MDWLTVLLVITVGLMCLWCFYINCMYDKALKIKTNETYQRGFQEGVKTSREFDASSFIDSKYAKYDSKQ